MLNVLTGELLPRQASCRSTSCIGSRSRLSLSVMSSTTYCVWLKHYVMVPTNYANRSLLTPADRNRLRYSPGSESIAAYPAMKSLSFATAKTPTGHLSGYNVRLS
jgi:hypothetical protein